MARRTALATWLDRQPRRFTQRQLARAIGISDPYVSLLLAGKRQPSMSMAVRIAKVTGLKLTDLVVRGERNHGR